MNRKGVFLRRVLLLLLTAGRPALGQPPAVDPGTQVAASYREAFALLEAGRTNEGGDRLQQLVDTFGADAAATIGPSFGNVYYHLGLARTAQGRTKDAVDAFRACYTRFPNPEEAQGARNEFGLHALMRWAELEQKRGRPQAAVQLLGRAIKECDDANQQNRMLVNLGFAYRDLNRRKEAQRVLEAALTRLGDGQSQEALTRRTVAELALLEAEQGRFVEVRRYLGDHPALWARPDPMSPGLVSVVLQVGRRCAFGGEPQLALDWYGLLADFETEDPTLSRAIRLARGGAHYQVFAYDQALEDYRVLARDDQAEPRQEILHAAAVCAGRTGLADEAGEYTQALHQGWPSYPRLAEAYAAWVEALLADRQDDTALAIADTFRETLPETSRYRESLDFAVASALYRLRRFPEAAAEFARFSEHFPDSVQSPSARYYQASSLVQIGQWQEALVILDSLAEADSSTDLQDGVLYYRGLCLFMLDDMHRASEALARLDREFPDSEHRPAGANLRGDLLLRRGDWEEADRTYTQGAEAADQLEGQQEKAAYARAQLVRIAVGRQGWTNTLVRFKAMVPRHPRSVHLAEAATAAATALDRLDRSDEAVELLTRLVRVFAGTARNPSLPTLLEAHHALYQRLHGPEALLKRLRDFPGPEPLPEPLAAWLLMGEIETLETMGKAADDPRLQACYHALTTSFDLDSLSDYFLLKLARWLRINGDPDQARSYYTVLIDFREPSRFTDYGRVEIAPLLTALATPEAFERALGYLREAQLVAAEPELMETAALEQARIHAAWKSWESALTAWQSYLDQPSWQIGRAEAHYGLGAAHDGMGHPDEALAWYLRTYTSYEGTLDWSARAWVRSALIHREQGDLIRAQAVLDDMMDRLGHLSHPVVNQARTLHRQWADEASQRN